MGRYLWKFKEFVIFPLNLRGDAGRNPKKQFTSYSQIDNGGGKALGVSACGSTSVAHYRPKGLVKLSKGGCRTFWSRFRPEGALGS
jgi:hypothetical protein